MESERVLSLPVEARWLFVIAILSADDLGIFEATEFKLARRADVGRDQVTKLLPLLADVDLARFYQVDGKQYGFVPRFRQRFRLKKLLHPPPPDALLADEPEILSEIKRLAPKMPDTCLTDAGTRQTRAAHARAESESESEKSIVATQRRRAAVAKSSKEVRETVATAHQLVVDLYNAKLADAIDGELRPRRAEGVGAKGRATAIAVFLDLAKARVATKLPNGGPEALGVWLGKYFDRAAADDFIAGRVPRRAGNEGWRASLESVIAEKTFLRLVEA